MSQLLEKLIDTETAVNRLTVLTELEDGKRTNVHLARYNRHEFKPKVVLFDRPTRLLDYCQDKGVTEALVGGFFLRAANCALGDVWINGSQQASVPVAAPWHKVRGSLHIDSAGELTLGRRNKLPAEPVNDLLQAGPMLVINGKSQIKNGQETEGVSLVNHQFDTDITLGRYPRAAIGLDDQFIWSVVCDGRSRQDAGLSLGELADVMVDLGAQQALNLDGGSSATQISDGIMRNNSRGDGIQYLRGRAIHTAILFS